MNLTDRRVFPTFSAYILVFLIGIFVATHAWQSLTETLQVKGFTSTY